MLSFYFTKDPWFPESIPITESSEKNSDFFQKFRGKNSEIRLDLVPRIVKFDEEIIKFVKMIGQTEKNPEIPRKFRT